TAIEISAARATRVRTLWRRLRPHRKDSRAPRRETRTPRDPIRAPPWSPLRQQNRRRPELEPQRPAHTSDHRSCATPSIPKNARRDKRTQPVLSGLPLDTYAQHAASTRMGTSTTRHSTNIHVFQSTSKTYNRGFVAPAFNRCPIRRAETARDVRQRTLGRD